MEWIADPTAWLGLLTLILLEIVLGIDNLVFIAILADRLPPKQRDKARLIGLGLALFMRVALLFSIAWLATLTAPLFHVFDHAVSGRDLILLAGGVFLLYKSTVELHKRLEGESAHESGPSAYAGFWSVVAQIVALDAVFSIDSVITAVGMADELSIMVIAVTVAIVLMMVASKPLTAFVNEHPTVIILCLSFLLMIGFSLIAEGVGFHIPKGYLYAAIGFSVLIEVFNQVAQANRRGRATVDDRSPRQRMAEAVVRLLGERPDPDLVAASATGGTTFGRSERNMVESVLQLADQPLRAIMTRRADVRTIDLGDPPETIAETVRGSPYSRLVVTRDRNLDEPVGVLEKKDLLEQVMAGGGVDLASAIGEPPSLPVGLTVLRALEEFKRSTGEMAFVVDEFGTFEGVVTRHDLTEAIAGEFPDNTDSPTVWIESETATGLVVRGETPLAVLRRHLQHDIAGAGRALTVAGYVLNRLERVPAVGESVNLDKLTFEVVRMEGPRIATVRVGGARGEETHP